jgi:DedD protein
MAQTDGEKELVLGNKQLIGLFFVVVALCGVFFAMGYMIGRNTARPASAALDASPPVAAAVPRSSEAEPPNETASTETPAPADTLSAPADPVTTPAVTKAAHDVPVQPVSQAGIPAPEPGASYLQVTALRRSDADNLVKTLREQNFPALLAASSKSDLFRVMVGPYHQTRQIADARARLKSLGFANAFVQK